MKICIKCRSQLHYVDRECIQCGQHQIIIDGFDAYAPCYADMGGGFKSEYFAILSKLEDKHFWFRSRNKLILWALNKYISKFRSFLEIGCGTGYVLSGVKKKYPNLDIYGSEIFSSGLAFAAKQVPSAKFMQMDARNIPFVDEFDVVGVFDVLEHIQEDEMVLSQIFSSLKPDGVILVTVPQHKWLWSSSDVLACHVRRYTSIEIEAKIKNAGFSITRSTSFVSSLLPAMFFSRSIKNKKVSDLADELNINPFLNEIFNFIMKFDFLMIKLGISLPFGGSRLVVARKIVK